MESGDGLGEAAGARPEKARGEGETRSKDQAEAPSLDQETPILTGSDRVGRPVRRAFLALVLAQAFHSVEEYLGRLYDVFPPARFVSGLVSEDRRVGFVIFNASLVAFGLWCFFGPIRRGRRSAPPLAWAWVLLETANGVGHVLWSAFARAYRPGLVTAPVLAALAWLLGARLRRMGPRSAPTPDAAPPR